MINSKKENTTSVIKTATGGRGSEIVIETLITHRIALDEIPDIFRMLTDGEKKTKAGVIKVVIHP